MYELYIYMISERGAASVLIKSEHSYMFDVDPKSNAFMNRRVFAYVDTGIADGIQLDAAGNVYAGCGDGVQVRPRTLQTA